MKVLQYLNCPECSAPIFNEETPVDIFDTCQHECTNCGHNFEVARDAMPFEMVCAKS